MSESAGRMWVAFLIVERYRSVYSFANGSGEGDCLTMDYLPVFACRLLLERAGESASRAKCERWKLHCHILPTKCQVPREFSYFIVNWCVALDSPNDR